MKLSAFCGKFGADKDRGHQPLCRKIQVSFLFFMVFSAFSSFGDHTRMQTFQVEAGWNAICLTVHPLVANPDALFSGVPVDVVATYDDVSGSGQFSTDPTVDMLRQLGWGTWYAPSREDAFLSDLGSIYGNKTYLIHALEPFVLTIEGRVVQQSIEWKPNAFNLVGFTLDATAPPTFAQFFDASDAHQGQAIYRLVNGIWSSVNALTTTLMKDGEAFWVYCDGSSSFGGPLTVETGVSSGVILNGGIDDVVIRNETSHPIDPTVEHIPAGADPVPLAIVIDVIGEDSLSIKSVPVSMGVGAWSQSLPSLEVGEATRVPLQLQADAATSSEMKSLLCIKSDLGTEVWVPVTGLQEDSK